MALVTQEFGTIEGSGCRGINGEIKSRITEIDELMDELESRDFLRYIWNYTLLSMEPKNAEEGSWAKGNVSWSGGGWPIHTDGNSQKSYQSEFRLVVPLFNTEGTKTRFFESSEPGTVHDEAEIGNNGTQYTIYNPEFCKEVTDYELTKPVLINTNIPHSVDGPINGMSRLSLGICFNTKFTA